MSGYVGLGAVLLALTLPALAGCAAGTTARTDPAPDRADTQLTIEVTASRGGATTTWSLRCAPAEGTHPDPTGACATLETLGMDAFAPVPANRACTQIYGGDQTARITGTWRGQAVNASYRRTDGCEIARWDSMRPVLPAAGGSSR